MWKQKLIGVFESILITLGMLRLTAATQKPHLGGLPWPNHRLILGHRGARLLRPENTLSAFKMAFERVDGIELDVHLSQDKVPVVIHDETLMRTTGFIGSVADYTAAVLLDLNAAYLMPKLPKEGIPTLQSVLSRAPVGAVVNIELKSTENFDNQTYMNQVLNVTKDYQDRLVLIFSSFDPFLLLALKEQAPKAYIAQLLAFNEPHFWQALKQMPVLSPDALHLTAEAITPILMKVAKKKNLKIGAWTVNNYETAERLFEISVDAIMTDDVLLMDQQGP